MIDNDLNESLQRKFLDLLQARRGHFKLESGHHGNLWLELDRLFLHPRAIQQFIIELARKLSAFDIDAICGPMVGGALIAQGIAAELDVEFFYTEKTSHQNPNVLYSANYQLPFHLRPLIEGRKVAIVDDVINAGSAVRATLTELQSLRANPVAVGAFLVLGETGKNYLTERSLPLRSISSLPNELWMPENCPLCASQIPLIALE
jgi:orotate phosphoribosyltransferase